MVLDPDDPAILSLRPGPKPLRLDEAGATSLKAALAAPMAHRNEVIGLAVLGRRPSGMDFRPDEIELIGWGTRQVGLDLHALKVQQLEINQFDLENTVSILRDEIATLRSVIPQRA
jgi:hypothetical protein